MSLLVVIIARDGLGHVYVLSAYGELVFTADCCCTSDHRSDCLWRTDLGSDLVSSCFWRRFSRYVWFWIWVYEMAFWQGAGSFWDGGCDGRTDTCSPLGTDDTSLNTTFCIICMVCRNRLTLWYMLLSLGDVAPRCGRQTSVHRRSYDPISPCDDHRLSDLDAISFMDAFAICFLMINYNIS